MSAGVAVQAQTAPERCPWCGTTIPRSKFTEIQSRIAAQERKRLADERARMEQEFRSERQKWEAAARAETAKKFSAFKAERHQRDAAIRKEVTAQTEARLKVEVDKKLAAIAAQRDHAKSKLQELETAKQQYERDLAQLRSALEKDRDSRLLKQEVQHDRERQQLQQKIDALNRQVQRKTADELGEGAEADVYEALRTEFSRDDIVRIKKGQPGADIRHEVLHKGAVCGTILIDSKDRQGWLNAYVTKLREDQMAAKADYAILATTVFPSGRKEFYIDEETKVIVVNRVRAVEIVGLLRRNMVRMHVLGLSQSERAEKIELLYKYITSEDFRQHVIEAGRLTTEMLDLDAEEKRTHDKVWEKRGKTTTRLRNVVREIDTEVSAILEGRRSASGSTK